MSTNQTSKYGFHLWEPGDDFLRAEFNENTRAVEDALGEKLEAVFGSYQGDGTVGRVIDLGFTPRCVILVNSAWGLNYAGSNDGVSGGVFFPETDIISFKIVAGGFQVSHRSAYSGSTNGNGRSYYIAFR